MEGISGILSRFTQPGAEAGVRLFGFRPKANARTDEELRKETIRTELMDELREVSRRLASIRSCLNYETDFDMIDSYILELDAWEKRYSYLLKRAKREQIRAF